MNKRVGVVGASGYTGAELLRLCAGHPQMDVVYATGQNDANKLVGDVYPSLAAAYPHLRLDNFEVNAFDDLDIGFLAVPYGVAQTIVPELRKRVDLVVDLSPDFRLRDKSSYPKWYGSEHTAPDLLSQFAFGIPELFRDELIGASLIAAPGCYVTAASLALAPLVRAGAIEPTGIIVDAASGVSGAGHALKPGTRFNAANEDFSAYGLLNHRHTPEIQQAIGAEVLFTPHLAPMNRGILASCYARPTSSGKDPLALLEDAYAAEPFVAVREGLPSTKATLGSNAAHITARYDQRTGWVVVLCALDNLVKGASGQALQCANVALGFPETEGLTNIGVYP